MVYKSVSSGPVLFHTCPPETESSISWTWTWTWSVHTGAGPVPRRGYAFGAEAPRSHEVVHVVVSEVRPSSVFVVELVKGFAPSRALPTAPFRCAYATKNQGHLVHLISRFQRHFTRACLAAWCHPHKGVPADYALLFLSTYCPCGGAPPRCAPGRGCAPVEGEGTPGQPLRATGWCMI